jgi:nitroimidazol reductase NimA-like FMN-containing flavoprotein (pyridoxamine 5'-phosphate oxidase superfamily)
MDRRMASLTETECFEFLARQWIGRLALVVDGWPVVVPMNYALVGRDIVVRSDPGSKLDAIAGATTVSFEVDDFDPLYQSGCSVLVRAVAREVRPEERPQLAEQGRLRSWADGPKAHWIRLVPVQVTGRRLARAWEYPDPTPGRVG